MYSRATASLHLRCRRSFARARAPGQTTKRTSIQFSIANELGGLLTPLGIFKDHNIDLTQLKSREGRTDDRSNAITMYCDFVGHTNEPHVQQALCQLEQCTSFLTVISSTETPFYPTSIEELDLIEQKVLGAGEELLDDPESPHPGFHDAAYRERRRLIVNNAKAYRHGMVIPDIEYTPEEVQTWGNVYRRLMQLFPTHTCRQYQYNFPLLVENCGFSATNIPQLQAISNFLRQRTGFSIRPVAGLLGARDFLNALAFRVFFSTQYIRHHSKPFYTPEPDICHELMGHAPMFADEEFANFSQEIGLASLGASDEDIKKLATCYWFSVEFGLCRQEGQVRAYGAGLLSSFGELEYCLSEKKIYDYVRQIRPFDPFEACTREYPITKYQPVYYVSESFSDAAAKMREYAKSLSRPFQVKYNPYTNSVSTLTTNTEQYMRGDW
eukprot:TRINITY_DN1829_c1_g1_i1.p1 TRINITY_DN1829_c1_g1~~TRINITY_DN1829_c1_g1_i1.p1  ORF type:complete len:450 (-),score=91.72 TRINITY_DN1829_c1_g1_i1:311-1630(-)